MQAQLPAPITDQVPALREAMPALEAVASMTPQQIRDEVKKFEDVLFTMPQEPIPVTHTFNGDTYVRSIVLRKGVMATGRRHRHASIHLVMVGRMTIVTEREGVRDVEAGSIFVSQPGSKLCGIALEDCIWATAHTVNTRDIPAIEADLCYSPEEEARLFPPTPTEALQ
jgi:hypothetical protein